MRAIRDSSTTGNFEIVVDGELVHSKTTKGDGFLDSGKKRKVVSMAIASVMKKPDYGAREKEVLEATEVVDSGDDKGKRMSLVMSIVSVVIAIPALVGA